ncbi:MAG TPA: hypothetical protein VLI90_16875, partial [Tepidisphaeraceae bacterium]|nr:hypothetical protein [Tepidisphaeraceae bacterium]
MGGLAWLSYNLLREPDGSTFVINRCMESRQRHLDWSRQQSPMAEKVELARAFASSIEERAAQAAQARAQLETDWPHFPPLDGREFGPYSFVHRTHFNWFPTEAQRAAAIAQLPYIARDSFVHQRADDRFPLVCTYVRRPTYYAAFDAGTHRSDPKRFGLGIIWNPSAGAVFQSPTGTDVACWGTRLGDAKTPSEAGDLTAEYHVGEDTIEPEPGHRDLPIGTLSVRYPLQADGEKTITFNVGNIAVAAKHAGAMTEQLPLLAPDGRVTIDDGRATVAYDGATLATANQIAVQLYTSSRADTWLLSRHETSPHHTSRFRRHRHRDDR